MEHVNLHPRFNGPPETANGGYACGVFGELVDGPAEVTLHSPPPLGVALDVDWDPDGTVSISNGTLVARARPVDGVDVEPPLRPSLAEAREASRSHPLHTLPDHFFARCYVCGPGRQDGLGIHFGAFPGRSDMTAAVFLPDATVPNRDGAVAPEIVWAALDCPSYTPPLWDWERPSLLARMSAERLDCVEVGEPMVAVGWHLASDGRKQHTASAVLAADGRVLARARSLWIRMR